MMNKPLLATNICLVGMMVFSVQAFQIGQIGDLLGAAKEKSIKNLVTSEPVSTSFNDASTAIVLPDEFGNNLKPKNLASMPRSPQGGYILLNGFYEMMVRSYCLHAGTHAPSKGDGYLFAPLKGKREEVIKTILRNSESHTEIPQNNIQLLIWAIQAKTKYSELSAQLKSAAQVLLTKKQISDLNGGVLGYIPEPLIRKVTASLPKDLQKIVEIENQMRNLFSKGSNSYTEFERLAMLPGEALVNRPDIKRGRWSKHPDGYYVRYYPSGYSKTKVQVYVPEVTGVSKSGGMRSSLLPSYQRSRSVIFDAIDDVAVPANTGAQRLAQSNVPLDGGTRRPSQPSPSCRQQVIDTLEQDQSLACLNFNFHRVRITPNDFREVANLIHQNRIQVSCNETEFEGSYNDQANSFRLKDAPLNDDKRATIIHESVHAIFDKRRTIIDYFDEEAIAFSIQTMYVLCNNLTLTSGRDGRTMTPPAAQRIARTILDGHTPIRADWAELRRLLLQSSAYGHRWGEIDDNNGIP